MPTFYCHHAQEATMDRERLLFSKVKEFLRRVAARVKGDLYEAIGDALREVTDQDIVGWFQNAGLHAAHG
jgi:hypothetical protein